MKLQVCSVFDLAVKSFMQPFFVRSKSEAVRSFQDAVGDKSRPFCSHPTDYVLFWLGEFDDASGSFEQPNTPEKLATALQFVEAVQA